MLKSILNTKFFRSAFLASALAIAVGVAPAHAETGWDTISSLDWTEILEVLGNFADMMTLLMGGDIPFDDF
ncbi:hypothetical protein [Bordetella muralis]|uniref:hypothetical protein n=1 Tax=Bordetella muralis TaxID=1649130 RepID=UPI0039EE2DAC